MDGRWLVQRTRDGRVQPTTNKKPTMLKPGGGKKRENFTYDKANEYSMADMILDYQGS